MKIQSMTQAALPLAILGVFLTPLTALRAQTADFEDLTFTSGDFENGQNLGTPVDTGPDGIYDVVLTTDGSFVSGPGTFDTQYQSFESSSSPDFNFTSWSGWAYSRTTDSTTPGFSNQYSAYPGSGVSGSAAYGIGYESEFAARLPTVDFVTPFDFSSRGLFVANTTYAYLSMRDGDGFAAPFGDDPETPDVETDFPSFFFLTIRGFLVGAPVGQIDYYLADYRFDDDSLDYLVEGWEFVDLSALGTVDRLEFDLTTSDVSSGFSNTPTYFAVDNIGAIPEPTSWALMGLAAIAVGIAARRRSRTNR